MPEFSKYLTEKFPQNLTINIGAKYSFSDFKKLEEWCDKEIEFYSKIGSPSNHDRVIQRLIKTDLVNRFNQNRNDEFSFSDLLAELKMNIEKTYKSYGIISLRSKKGKWLLELHNKNPHLIQGAVNYFVEKELKKDNQIHHRDGEFAAFLFESGIEPSFKLENERYNDFYEEISAQKDQLISELRDEKLKNEQLNEHFEKQNKDWEEKFEIKLSGISEKFEGEFKRHSSQMSENEDFYTEKLAVKKAVSYWSNKAVTHKKNAIGFGVVAGLLMIGAIVSIVLFGKYISNLDLQDESGFSKRIISDSGALQLWVYGILIITATLSIWIIRLLVKVFLSNLHLLSDAKERETMIMTYLALEREDKVISKEDRGLILPSIFRSTNNGFIKEDSSPNTPLNVLLKRND